MKPLGHFNRDGHGSLLPNYDYSDLTSFFFIDLPCYGDFYSVQREELTKTKLDTSEN